MFTLEDTLVGAGARLHAGQPQAWFTGVSVDSRSIVPGELFVALQGARSDGHRFVAEALGRGAAGALVDTILEDEPWAADTWGEAPILLAPDAGRALIELAGAWRAQHDVRVVGVTGSVGKTSTKEVIAGVLAQHFSVLRSPGNLNTEIGLPLALMRLTPQHEVAVLEMAMHDIGEIARLASIARPAVGIVTNVFPTHLERLGTIERIAEAKAELIRALPVNGLAVLNHDDERVRAMAPCSKAPVLTYGMGDGADLQAKDVRGLGLEGIRFVVGYQGQCLPVATRLLGTHSISAALAAIGTALWFGMGLDEAVRALANLEPGPRLTVLPGQNGSTLIDDTYNASPASVLAALDLLSQMEGRRIAVLGDMLELGEFEEEGHRLVGERAAAVADGLIAVGPRATRIAKAAIAHGLPASAVHLVENATAAADHLRPRLGPTDHVLVKGSRALHLEECVNALRVEIPETE